MSRFEATNRNWKNIRRRGVKKERERERRRPCTKGSVQRSWSILRAERKEVSRRSLVPSVKSKDRFFKSRVSHWLNSWWFSVNVQRFPTLVLTSCSDLRKKSDEEADRSGCEINVSWTNVVLRPISNLVKTYSWWNQRWLEDPRRYVPGNPRSSVKKYVLSPRFEANTRRVITYRGFWSFVAAGERRERVMDDL